MGWSAIAAVIESISHVAVAVGVALAAVGLVLRRREIFMPAIAKKRMEHVEGVRRLAEEVACDSYFAFTLGDIVVQWQKSLAEIQREDPLLWDTFRQVQVKSIKLYQMCKNEKHYLWPGWIEVALIRELASVLETVQPFTPSAFGRKSIEQQKFMNGLARVVCQFDDRLRHQARRWLPKT